MSRTEAQIAASRANGLKSRGPISAEGKAISRRNSLKHGMAGEGVVVPEGDSAEVARRSAAMMVEMRPSCEMGRYLVKRLARLTVRVERCSSQELAAIEYRAAHAEAEFDEARLSEVDHLIGYLAHEPATYSRKLRSMPEGVDRMIACLLELREELDAGRWDWTYGDKLANLLGKRWAEVPVIRVRALSEAIEGNFRFLSGSDGEGLTDPERIAWARESMGSLIDQEIESLLEHRKTLDLEAIEADRAGAANRSSFDPSRAAILARRYEAAAERAVYKALNELRQVEAQVSTPMEDPIGEVSGSFGAEDREEASGPALGVLTPRERRPIDRGVLNRPTPERIGKAGSVANWSR